jgi:hypothetical protein
MKNHAAYWANSQAPRIIDFKYLIALFAETYFL